MANSKILSFIKHLQRFSQFRRHPHNDECICAEVAQLSTKMNQFKIDELGTKQQNESF